jgi:hypothetical protein
VAEVTLGDPSRVDDVAELAAAQHSCSARSACAIEGGNLIASYSWALMVDDEFVRAERSRAL